MRIKLTVKNVGEGDTAKGTSPTVENWGYSMLFTIS